MNDNCFVLKKKYKNQKIRLCIYQILLLLTFLTIWELLAYFDVINTFIFSRPSDIFKLLVEYIKNKEIFVHMKVSVIETLLGIIIGSVLGIIIAIIWGTITYATKYVSVGSIIALLLSPFLMYLFKAPVAYICYCALGAIYIVYLHRENIKRLIAGNENKVR